MDSVNSNKKNLSIDLSSLGGVDKSALKASTVAKSPIQDALSSKNEVNGLEGRASGSSPIASTSQKSQSVADSALKTFRSFVSGFFRNPSEIRSHQVDSKVSDSKKLSYQQRRDDLPLELSNNTKLEELDLSGSFFQTFPDLKNCSRLKKIDLSQSNLQGRFFTFDGLKKDRYADIAEKLPKDMKITINGALNSIGWPENVTVTKRGRNEIEVTVNSKPELPATRKKEKPQVQVAKSIRQDSSLLKNSPLELKEKLKDWDVEDQKKCLENDGLLMLEGEAGQSNAKSVVKKIVDFIVKGDLKLDLNNAHLASLPKSVFFNKSLKELDCRNNPGLSALPEDMSQCTTLEKLNLTDTSISVFPNLSNCKKLKEVDLTHSGLRGSNAVLAERLPIGVSVLIRGLDPQADWDSRLSVKVKNRGEILVTRRP